MPVGIDRESDGFTRRGGRTVTPVGSGAQQQGKRLIAWLVWIEPDAPPAYLDAR